MTPARRTAAPVRPLLRPAEGAPAASERLAEAIGRLDLPWTLIGPALPLVGLGLAGLAVLEDSPVARQAAYLLPAAAAFVLAAATPAAAWRRWAPAVYAAGLAGLAAVLVLGRPVRGTRAWLDVGPVSIQVAEFAKVAVALLLARILSAPGAAEAPAAAVGSCVAAAAVPLLLILEQPDLGTGVVLLAILVAAPYAAGLPSTYLTIGVLSAAVLVGRLVLGIAQAEIGMLPAGGAIDAILAGGGVARLPILVALGGAAAGCAAALVARRSRGSALAAFLAAAAPAGAYAASFLVERHLKPYQRLRLLTFIAPETDPRGAGYNVLQSEIAVGSGGLLGKGIDGASQSALGFLPEASTDFVFAVVAEAFGLIGAAAVILLYAGLLFALLGIARRAADAFGAILCASIAAFLGLHALVNIGMAMGSMPVMGIPLPLLSYGGSSAVATAWALGLAASVHAESKRS